MWFVILAAFTSILPFLIYSIWDWALICFFAVWIFGSFAVGQFHPEVRRTISPLIVSIGILGTFVGVSIALWFFDPDAQGASIDGLLNGLKIAFFTSSVGLFFNILARWMWRSRGDEPLGQGEQQIVAELADIRKAISHSGESSLSSQLRDLHEINRAGFQQLEGLTDAIREALVDNITNLINEIQTVIKDELATALQDLIRSIDQTINQMLGKKLDEFNESVDLLRKWQLENQAQIEQLTTAFQQVASGTEQIATASTQISRVMEKLRDAVSLAESQIGSLDERLAAFANMKQQAEAAFPLIDQKLSNIVEVLSKSARGFQGLEETVTRIHRESAARIEKGYALAKRQIDASRDQLERVISQIGKDTEKTITSLNRETTRQISQNSDLAQKQINDTREEISRMVIEMRSDTEGTLKQYREEMRNYAETLAQGWVENLVAVAEACRDAIKEVEAMESKQR